MGMFDDIPAEGKPTGGMFDDIPATPAAPKSYSWSEVPGAALRNAPASAGQFAGNIWQAIRHPIDTAESLGKVGLGALEYAGLSPTSGHEQYASAAAQALRNRYGGIEQLKRTLAEDPVGALGDVSVVGTGGGGLAARLPGVAGKIGEVASTVGRAANPLQIGTKAVGATARATGITGAGAEQATLFGNKVLMTPGQMIGGYFKTLEDAASGWPLLGDWIKSGRKKTIESFNQAVGNQALAPIGGKVASKAGHDLIDEVESKLGDAYDTLLPRVNFAPDPQWFYDLRNIANNKVSMLTPDRATQFENIFNQRIGNHATVGMSGPMFKQVESELTHIAKSYTSSFDADQRFLGQAINGVVDAMRANLERANPTHAAELAKINHGWAMYARMRDAASRRATSAGVFTPNDLLAAIKAGDKSVAKGSFAKGDALMQTFAEAGQKVLPSSIPTSGTSERLLHLGAIAAAPQVSMPYLAAGATAAMPYTWLGMHALRQTSRIAGPTRVATRIGPILPLGGRSAALPPAAVPKQIPYLSSPGVAGAEEQNQPVVPGPEGQKKYGGRVKPHMRPPPNRRERVKAIVARYGHEHLA